jgi:hypothetical protein
MRSICILHVCALQSHLSYFLHRHFLGSLQFALSSSTLFYKVKIYPLFWIAVTALNSMLSSACSICRTKGPLDQRSVPRQICLSVCLFAYMHTVTVKHLWWLVSIPASGPHYVKITKQLAENLLYTYVIGVGALLCHSLRVVQNMLGYRVSGSYWTHTSKSSAFWVAGPQKGGRKPSSQQSMQQ